MNMVTGKKKVEISLMGQRFSLRSDRDEEYVQGLARFVTAQLDEMRLQTKTVSTHHLAVLVALNLADQLFRHKEEVTQLKGELQEKAKAALTEVEAALSHLRPPEGTESVAPPEETPEMPPL